MSSPVRQDSDTTEEPSPKPSRRGYVMANSPTGVCSISASTTWPLITIAARVPSRDNCSSVMAPGNFDVTAAESTGMRAGWPEASSWITRTTLLPSTTTQTASSSAHDGRVSDRASVTCAAAPPLGPIHNDDAMSGAPGRRVTTEAMSRPVRDSAAAAWSPIAPNDPGTGVAR